MREFRVAFAGQVVLIRYRGEAMACFLSLLFADLHGEAGGHPEHILTITAADRADLPGVDDGDLLCCPGVPGVAFAAALFDRVIFHLLDRNAKGVALHAGAVAHGRHLLLLPGHSGAGKSTLVAWLTALGFAYLTDELIFLPLSTGAVQAFTRPLCIKPGGKESVKGLLAAGAASRTVEDGHGMIVPHRALNPTAQPQVTQPSILLFPTFQPGARPNLTPISPAQAGAGLIACNVNGRNLPEHGFSRLMDLARATRAYRLTFGNFTGLDQAIDSLLVEAS